MDCQVVDIEKWPGPALVRVTGNSAARHFAVTSYDAGGNQLELLVNTTDPYTGVRPLDFFDGQQTTRFEVIATGDWQIEVLPILDYAAYVDVPGAITGSGDAVVLLRAEADTATITGNAASAHFAVQSYGGGVSDLVVNTTDPYDNEVLLKPGARIFVITAVGDWTIDLTAR